MVGALSLAALASGAAHIYTEYRPPLWARYLFKPLVLALLMVVVAQSVGFGWLLLGLFFCWLGDIALMMPSNSDRWFLAGLTSFLLGHLCYVALMWAGLSATPMFAWLGFAAIALLASVLIARPAGKLGGAVLAYIAAILLMGAAAVGQYTQGVWPVTLLLGVCLFMLSDFLLGFNRFNRAIPLSQVWVLGTYYLAQVLIVSSHVSIGE